MDAMSSSVRACCPWTTPHRESPRVDSNHDCSGSEPDASAMLGYEGIEPRVGIEPTAFRLQGGCSAELSFKGGNPRRGTRTPNPSPRWCAARRPGPTRTGARGFEAHCSPPLSYGAKVRRQQGSNLRTRSTRLRRSRARWSGRRGSRTPKPVRAARFRDGVPRRWQSFRVQARVVRNPSNLQPSG